MLYLVTYNMAVTGNCGALLNVLARFVRSDTIRVLTRNRLMSIRWVISYCKEYVTSTKHWLSLSLITPLFKCCSY